MTNSNSRPADAAKTYNRTFDPAGDGKSGYIGIFFDYYDRRLSRREA